MLQQMGANSYILNREEFFSKGKLINKFMPLEKALSLLETKTIWFANPETWPDPYEKYFLCAKYGSKDFPWLGRIYCSCFTNNASSEASWNAYSKNEICVRLTFDSKRLLSLLDNYQKINPKFFVCFDTVQYMRTNSIVKNLDKIPFEPSIIGGFSIQKEESKARLMLLKRKAFSYEDEYRAIIVRSFKSPVSGIKVEIPDINTLISGVAIDPRVGGYTFKMLKNYIADKYHFPKGHIQQSLLYKTINQKVILNKSV